MGYRVSGSPEKRSKLRSLTRLVIGGALAGYDGLTKRLSQLESEFDKKDSTDIDAINTPNSYVQDSTSDHQDDNENQADLIRYAVIGLIIDAQDALSKGLDRVDRISLRAGGLFNRVARPIYSSRLLTPMRSRVDRLAQRGQYEVEHWIELGRKEEIRSRELANNVLVEQVDNSIEYLTSNTEVQELVQSQSVGLIGEIVEETRERTVSADYYIEAWARTIFRRPMRSELPEPPKELKTRALPYRRIQGKIIKK